ncbi:MAG: hypothetical protein AAF108_11270, partial [Planctomycetota bacterium]
SVGRTLLVGLLGCTLSAVIAWRTVAGLPRPSRMRPDPLPDAMRSEFLLLAMLPVLAVFAAGIDHPATPWWYDLISAIPMLLAPVLVVFASLLVQLEPLAGRCAACGTDLSASPEAAECPACAADVTEPGAVVTEGPAVRVRIAAALGVALIGGLVFLPLAGSGPLLFTSSFPTSALVALAPYDRAAMEELEHRPLSDEQIASIAERYLKTRGEGGRFPTMMSGWIGQRLINRPPDDSLREMWLRTSARVSLDAPPVAAVGEPFEVLIRVRDVGVGTGILSFAVPGTPSVGTPMAPPEPVRVHAVDSLLGVSAEVVPAAILRVTPEQPGPLTLEWPVAVVHSGTAPSAFRWEGERFASEPEPVWSGVTVASVTVDVVAKARD